MRAKPDMKPWENRKQQNSELRRSGTTARVSEFTLGCAAPLGLNEWIWKTNPGLAPWAMQEYRPYRASLRLPYHYYFDAVALP